ncbi:MAG: hypothetical protein ACRC6D_10600, partial [Aeromonas sp.]
MTGWQLAETIRSALINNLLAGETTPEISSLTYHEQFSSEPTIYRSEPEIISAIRDRGAPDVALFKAESLWPWLAKNLDLSPELHEVISTTYPPKADTTEPKTKPNTAHNERVDTFTNQLAELTERLRLAENEIAELKTAPRFRHMT